MVGALDDQGMKGLLNESFPSVLTVADTGQGLMLESVVCFFSDSEELSYIEMKRDKSLERIGKCSRWHSPEST